MSFPDQLADQFAAFGPTYLKWLRAGVDDDRLTYARMRLVHLLLSEGSQIMSQLKSRLGVTARNVTALVDALEGDGLVRRQPHPSDRRAVVVELTDEGRNLHRRLFRKHHERARSLFESLDPSDQEALATIMAKLTTLLEARAESEGLAIPCRD